jgi:hypothetical protein
LSYYADGIKFGITMAVVEEKTWQNQIQKSMRYVRYGMAVTDMSELVYILFILL